MEHKIEDLIAAVRAIPPSGPTVIPGFINKCLSKGELSDDEVRTIVENWPGGCPEGKKKFLDSVGIAEEKKQIVRLVGYIKRYDDGANRMNFEVNTSCFRDLMRQFGFSSDATVNTKILTPTWDGKTPLPLVGVDIQDPRHPDHRYVFTSVSIKDSNA